MSTRGCSPARLAPFDRPLIVPAQDDNLVMVSNEAFFWLAYSYLVKPERHVAANTNGQPAQNELLAARGHGLTAPIQAATSESCAGGVVATKLAASSGEPLPE